MARREARRKRLEGPVRRLGMAAQNALEIVRVGRLSSTRGAPFEVVHADPIYRLRHYQGAGARAGGGPALVLVPPLMVASEVYDIAPDISAVGALVREGVDVWITDFGAPEREEGGLERTLDDHVRAVSDAVDRVRAATGRDVHLAGYSQGGMFVYQAAALRRSEGLASLVTFGSPVDIHRSVPNLSDQVTEHLVRLLQGVLAMPLDRIEGLPGKITSGAFKVLSARKEISQLLDFVRKLHDRQALEKRESKRLFLRGGGFVAWPGPALRKFIDDIIVGNRMSTGGFVIDGRPVTLADIHCPIVSFFGERDDIARPAAVRAIARAAPNAEVYEIPIRAGHFGLVVGSSALATTWPAVTEWLEWREGRRGPPAALARGGEPDASELDDVEMALEDLQFDLRLAYDVVTKAAGTAWTWAGDVTQNLADSLDQLRWQLPRLSRLRHIEPDTPISMSRVLARQAARMGDDTFFLWRGRAFSYEVANRRVDNVVRGLIACGVRRGDHVGVLMGGRPSYLTIVTATLRLGGVAVLLSPESTGDALRRGAELGRVDWLVADPEHAKRALSLGAADVLVLGGGADRATLGGDVVDMEAINPDAVKLPAWYEPDPGRAGDLAMILVSAGRSGEPRAARVTHHRWAFSAIGAAAACTLTPRDTVYSSLPLHHAAGSLVATGSALVGGARLALGDRPSPETFWTEVRRYGATVVFYAGEMCRPLVRAPYARGETNHPVRLFAGSGMRADVWERLLDRFGPTGVLEFYASTETNAVLANASGEKVGSVGRPLPGSSELAIAAFDTGAGEFARGGGGRCVRAPTGEPGMLLARLDADTLATAPDKRVLRGAFDDGDTWYVTGDIVRRDVDGDHWLEGRAGDVIRTTGGGVFPRRVEDALYSVPGVAKAVAYGEPDGSAERVIGAVALDRGAEIDPAALAEAVAALAEPARPREVRVVDDIPTTEGFRPLREPIRAAARRGDPARAVFVLDGGRYAGERAAAGIP